MGSALRLGGTEILSEDRGKLFRVWSFCKEFGFFL